MMNAPMQQAEIPRFPALKQLELPRRAAEQPIPHKSCRKAEPLLGNKIAIQRGIGIFKRSPLVYLKT